jgi:hypothetical protein
VTPFGACIAAGTFLLAAGMIALAALAVWSAWPRHPGE